MGMMRFTKLYVLFPFKKIDGCSFSFCIALAAAFRIVEIYILPDTLMKVMASMPQLIMDKMKYIL